MHNVDVWSGPLARAGGLVWEVHMQLNLTDRETEVLRGLLQDYLPDLRWQVARTEERVMRHEMVERQNLVERLLEELTGAVP